MKALILGCGNIGSVAAKDLAESIISLEVVVADKDKKRAKEVAQKIARSNVSWIQLDAADYNGLVKAVEGFDLVLGFLPGKLGYRQVQACIEAGTDLVDVSYMAENPLTLNDNAMKADVTVVPDCGLAPGISNILVGHVAAKFDKVDKVKIMVGGLPEKALPPLGYTITWSPESLVDEYTRKAVIVTRGKKVEVEALTGLEEIEFPNVGKLEAFYTDGLRTLLHTVKNAREMCEKTLRYPGHAERIGLLKALGFFDEKPITVENVKVSPRKLTTKLLGQKLWKPKIKDIVMLKVEVSGVKNGNHARYAYYLLDHFDKKEGVTAMARTTGYTASIVAQLMLKKIVKQKGVVPPEKLGVDGGFFQLFMSELEKRNIGIVQEKTD